MKITIENPGPYELGEKRFYPPFRITDTCPKCGADVEYCSADKYISYPVANAPIVPRFYCGACEDEGEWEWDGPPIIIRVTAELAPVAV